MIGDRSPAVYFHGVAEQCNGGPKKYSGITDVGEMKGNFRMNCLPERMLDGEIPEFDAFLNGCCKLMVLKIQRLQDASR